MADDFPVKYLFVDDVHSMRLLPEFVHLGVIMSYNARVINESVKGDVVGSALSRCCAHGVVEFEVHHLSGLARGCIALFGDSVYIFVSTNEEAYSVGFHVIHACMTGKNKTIGSELISSNDTPDLVTLFDEER